MQSHWVNHAPYYRCRFPAEYAIANHVEHPLNVHLREDAVIGHVDEWLAREFVPHPLTQTIHDLAAAQQPGTTPASDPDETADEIADCDRKLAQYRAALDAGGPATPRPRMTETQIKAIIDKLADITLVLRDADPDDKAEIFRQLGLKLTYHPGRQLVQAQIVPA